MINNSQSCNPEENTNHHFANTIIEKKDDLLLTKKRKKKLTEMYIPIKRSFKSAAMLIDIIDIFIKKYDFIHLLRFYRKELKFLNQYNALGKKEKLLWEQNGFIDFDKNTLVIDLKETSFISEPFNYDSSNCNFKQITEEYYIQLEKDFDNVFIEKSFITNIDILRYKAECVYYSNIKDFTDDIYHLFKYIYLELEELISFNLLLAKKYLTSLYVEFINLITIDFKNIFDDDINDIIINNKLPKITGNYKNTPMKKSYQEIENYVHILNDYTNEKTKTNLKPNCNGECCDSFEKLGPLNLEKGNWNSCCVDRINNMECNPDYCGCKENCLNQSFRRRDFKKLNIDVIERYSWGIDLFTYRNIIEFLPNNFKEEFKAKNFIEDVLVGSFYKQDNEGYDIKKTCEYIFETFNSPFNLLAEHLKKVFDNSKSSLQSSNAYSKGIGIFCMRKEGIKMNEIISGYFGEIYPPWYWYEKQDIIKQKKLDKELPDFYNIMLERLKNDEKGYDLVMVDPNAKGNFASRMSHSCMPNCNTVLVASGNDYNIGMFATKDIKFGEELTFDYNSVTEKEKEFQKAICLCSSYSCRGRYLIFSNSMVFTEVLSKYHSFLHRNGILLEACSNPSLSEEDVKYLEKYSIKDSILKKAPMWLKKWASLILKFVEFEEKILPIELEKSECFMNKDKLKSDNKKNKKRSMKSAIQPYSRHFNSDFVWGAKQYKSKTRGLSCLKKNNEDNKNIIIIINNEGDENSLYSSDDISKDKQNNYDLVYSDKKSCNIEEHSRLTEKYKYQISAISESRIQNIAITIDKVIHVLSLFNTTSPPLIKLNEEEVFEYLWGDKNENSIRLTLLKKLKLFASQHDHIITLLDKNIYSDNEITSINNKKFFTTKINFIELNKKAREILITVSKELRKIPFDNKIFYQALADIIYLHANTKTLFHHNKLYTKSVKSIKIDIRKRDIHMGYVSDLDTISVSEAKDYDKLYIWGQLVGWFKQTVDKPNASLSAERRGSLSYPDIETFFMENINNSVINYPYSERQIFFNKLCENPSLMWPVGNDWSYKNRNKIYGTVQLDSIIKSKFDDSYINYLNKVFDNI